jgi:exopolyphosphatase/pppGpp-phosphohydrolase
LLVVVMGLGLGACEDDEGGGIVDAGALDGAAARDVAAAQDVAAADVAAGRDVAAAPDAPAEARPTDGPPAAVCPAKPAEAECEPFLDEAIPLSAGRVRQCAFDIGSTNVKVIITSTMGTDRDSIEGDRVCKKAMRLRDRVQDAMMMPKAFAEADMNDLVAQLGTYGQVCTKDKGTVVGAVATQWARTATNGDQIRAWFQQKMGMPLAIINGDQEGAYGYAAATHDQKDRIILDAGGGSFQLTYWVTGDAKPTAASVPFGHDASSDKVWTKPEHAGFGTARVAYVDELQKLIAATPATAEAFTKLGELVKNGKLNPEMISLGDSGVILAVEGKLQDAAGKWVDELTYLARLDDRRRELATSTVMGPKKTLTLTQINAFLDKLAANRASFEDLRGECVRKAYGGKVLGHLTLMSHLITKYGLGQRAVFTSGEMAEGFILEKLR